MAKPTKSAVAALEQVAARSPVAPEVEDVLAVVHDTDTDAAARLEAISASCRWMHVEDASLARRVPMATWAELVVRFLRDGPAAVLVEATNARADDGRRAIAIGVLEEAADIGGLGALVTAAAEATRRLPLDLEFAFACAKALNLVLRGRELDVTAESTVRSFLHRLWCFAETDTERAEVLLGLRWVGDESSATLLDAAPALKPPWHDVIGVVRKELGRRARRKKP